jgi:cytochrome c oxidase accessory protein FixG
MEMVFRKIEYLIEGDAWKQKILNNGPWTGEKIWKKTAKHGIFFALSFLIGNLLLAYIIGSEALLEIVTDNPLNHLRGLTAMILFSLLFYGIFARFREQACTFICPYGRFQSVLLDEHSIVVAYDYKRGEQRGQFVKRQPREDRLAAGLGDCIDCGLCVDVCPTGIDIRNGTQMECVNCTACIDACNRVMSRVGFPAGLIRYASQNGIALGEKLKITPRIIVYSALLVLLSGFLAFLLLNRAEVETSLLRTPGTLYQELPADRISNLYLVKVMNKTNLDKPITLKLENLPGEIKIAGSKLLARKQELAESAVVIEIPRDALTAESTPIEVGIYSEGALIEVLRTSFMGPARSP